MTCRSPLFAVVALLLAATALPCLAEEVSLELTDGRVLEGTAVRRDGPIYLLDLPEGGVVTIPAPLVSQVRLAGAAAEVGEPAVPAPGGMRLAGPESLAGASGEPVGSLTAEEQTAAIGAPSRFAPDVVDSRWAPESDWSDDPAQNMFAPSTWADGPVDPRWQPEPAFDAREDVLRDGRSTWQKSIVDPAWKPTDGFGKRRPTSFGRPVSSTGLVQERWALKSGRIRGSIALGSARPGRPLWPSLNRRCPLCPLRVESARPKPRSAAEARDRAVLACSRRFLANRPELAAHPIAWSRLVDGPVAADLPLNLYLGRGGAPERPVRGIVSVAGDRCRLIGGDLSELHGLELSPRLALGQVATTVAAAIRDAATELPASTAEQIRLVASIVALADARMADGPSPVFVVLENERDERVLELRRLGRTFEPPSSRSRDGGTRLRFMVWLAASDRIHRVEALLTPDGEIAVTTEPTVDAVGR